MKIFSNDPSKTRTVSKKFSTQTRWFSTDPDIEFEDSFKFWFALMWQNLYILIFVIGLVPTILELTHLDWCKQVLNEDLIPSIIGLSIAPAILITVTYKGLIQYWMDMKKGKGR